MNRARGIRFSGEFTNFASAAASVRAPGDMALVVRGVARLVVLACPDGCGDVIPINVDPRAGRAWRYYTDRNGRSLFPSVWRDQGCCAHFILWRDRIFWTEYESLQDDVSEELIDRVADELLSSFESFELVATRLDEVPWAVWLACQQLVRRGMAEEATGSTRGRFRRK